MLLVDAETTMVVRMHLLEHVQQFCMYFVPIVKSPFEDIFF